MKRAACRRARAQNIPFDPCILDDIEAQLELGLCALSDLPFDMRTRGRGKISPYAPSLDRIHPELGYVSGNVRVILYSLNVALSNWGQQQFEQIALRHLMHARPDLVVSPIKRRNAVNDNQLDMFSEAA